MQDYLLGKKTTFLVMVLYNRFLKGERLFFAIFGMQRWLTSWKRYNPASKSKNKLTLCVYIFKVQSLCLKQQVFAQRR